MNHKCIALENRFDPTLLSMVSCLQAEKCARDAQLEHLVKKVVDLEQQITLSTNNRLPFDRNGTRANPGLSSR